MTMDLMIWRLDRLLVEQTATYDTATINIIMIMQLLCT